MSGITFDYKYCLHGSYRTLQYTTYANINEYCRKKPRSMSYRHNEAPPRDVDFLLIYMNDDVQKKYLDPLVEQIRSITPNRDDQLRIAVSLVQHIDYDMDGVINDTITNKYPYEVLYTRSGVCEEKSRLLCYLARGLGYGCVLFRYPVDNHAAVGIKCPKAYRYLDFDYCFVESTTPTIMTDCAGEHVGSGKLTTRPRALLISQGLSFNSVVDEYNDAVEYNKIVSKGQANGKALYQNDYDKWTALNRKYGIQPVKQSNQQSVVNRSKIISQPAPSTRAPINNQQDKTIQINFSELARTASNNIANASNTIAKYLRKIKK